MGIGEGWGEPLGTGAPGPAAPQAAPSRPSGGRSGRWQRAGPSAAVREGPAGLCGPAGPPPVLPLLIPFPR